MSIWLTAQVDAAIDATLQTELEEERAGLPPPRDPSSRDLFLTFLTEAFGLRPDLGRGAAVSFNALPFETRQVFFALVVQFRTPAQCVREGLGTVEEVRTRARQAFHALGFLTADGSPPELGP